MKRILLFLCFLLSCALSWAQTTTVTMVFTGEDSLHYYVRLDSVRITNETRDWSETIYYPDTTLYLNTPDGIGCWTLPSGLLLSQNIPNPFAGRTNFSLSIEKSSAVDIQVISLDGKRLADYTGNLTAGSHTFAVEMAVAQTALLVVRTPEGRATIKLVNQGSAGANAIRYQGAYPLAFNLRNDLKSTVTQPFTPGDVFRFEGWALLNGVEVPSIPIVQPQYASTFRTLHFNDSEHTIDTTIVDTTIIDTTVIDTTVIDTTIIDTTIIDTTIIDTTIIDTTIIDTTIIDTTIIDTTVVDPTLPLGVVTDSVYLITTIDAYCAGHLTGDGGDTILMKGICWSPGDTPTLSDQVILCGSGLDPFAAHIEGLSPFSCYFARAFAITPTDTAFGNILKFITQEDTLPQPPACPPGNLVTDIDGNSYSTVLLGSQCWMASNLRTTNYADGTPIPQAPASTNSDENPYYYYVNADGSTTSTYGLLYNWPAATRGMATETYPLQGACPDGWHMPSIDEWNTLIDFVRSEQQYWCSSSYSIGKSMAATTSWNSSTNTCAIGNTPSTNNSTGFGILASGLHNGYSAMFFGENGQFWTASSEGGLNAGSVYSKYSSTSVHTSADIWNRYDAFAVRCVYGAGGYVNITTADAARTSGNTEGVCGGTITVDGGLTITARGIVWGTTPRPTLENCIGHTVDGAGLGSFASTLTNLNPEVTYYVRAYATNALGTIYGDQKALVNIHEGEPCVGAATVTDINGNVYPTVQVGTQCWMGANLRATSYPNGSSISYGSSSTSTTYGYYYYVNGNSSNTGTYGLLYNWSAVMNGASSSSAEPSGVQGICPSGWHLPSRNEYLTLHEYLTTISDYNCDHITYTSSSMASTSGWQNWSLPCVPGGNQSANNATGLSIYPAGKLASGAYEDFSDISYLWTSTKLSSNAYAQRINSITYTPYVLSEPTDDACAVRCVRN